MPNYCGLEPFQRIPIQSNIYNQFPLERFGLHQKCHLSKTQLDPCPFPAMGPLPLSNISQLISFSFKTLLPRENTRESWPGRLPVSPHAPGGFLSQSFLLHQALLEHPSSIIKFLSSHLFSFWKLALLGDWSLPVWPHRVEKCSFSHISQTLPHPPGPRSAADIPSLHTAPQPCENPVEAQAIKVSLSHLSSTDTHPFPDSQKTLVPISQASFPKPFQSLSALEIQVVCAHNTHLWANVSFHSHQTLSPGRNSDLPPSNQHRLYFRLFHFPIRLVFQPLGTYSSLTFFLFFFLIF